MKNILKIVTIFFIINSSLMAEVIHIGGSSTIFPIIKEIDSKYFNQNGITLSISGGDSDKGIECLLKNECQIGMIARALSEEETAKGIKGHLVGYDGIAIIVNKNNPISNISTKNIQNIYSGKINNWKELNGDNHEILPISKNEGRAARQLFDKYFNIHKQRENIEYVGSNIEDLVIVALEEYSIGYVSIGSAQHAIKSGADIKMLQLDGIAPIKEGKINNSYPLIHALNLTTYGKYGADVQKIISVMTSDVGKQFNLSHIIVSTEEMSYVK